MTQNNTKYYLHYDQVGSLRAVSDTSGNIIKEITYDTYGNILSDTNANFKVPFGFAGGLYDSDTKLTRFGYRDYDSYTGKWTAKDPIDFAGGDTNLYGYVLGDPVGFVDVEGKQLGITPTIGVGGGIHLGIAGFNYHYNNSGQSLCARVGPGIYLGGGLEVGANAQIGKSSQPWTAGVGADLAFGFEGFGGSLGANTSSLGGSLSGKGGVGFGASGGLECCISW